MGEGQDNSYDVPTFIMTEETKEEVKEEPKELNIVEKAAKERQALEVVRDDIRKDLAEMKELKATEILSGKADAPKEEEKPKEETPAEYAKRALQGGV